MKIHEILFKAGITWDRVIYDYCKANHIAFFEVNTQKVDVILKLIDDKDNKYLIAVELKYTDLHKSLTDKGTDGNLRWELQQYYLPRRPKTYDDIWLFVAPYPDMRDGVILDSICADNKITKKSYFTQEAAIKGMVEFAKNWKKMVDLSMPVYINESGEIDQLSKMLRVFPGFTEEWIQKVREYRDVFGFMPIDNLENIYEIIKDDNPNLARLWYDWFYGGIEPKNNTIKNGI